MSRPVPTEWVPDTPAPSGAPPPRARSSGGPPRLTGAPRRRRRAPYLVLGVLLVLASAVAGVLVATRLGATQSVLVLDRLVTVGHVLTEQDLREAAMASSSGVDTVSAGSLSEVVGQPVAYSLPAGTLLTRAALGAPQVPPPGQAIAAVGLKAGQFPPDLTPGTRVTAVAAADTAVGSSPAARPLVSTWQATVVGVQAKDDQQTTVVALLMAEGDARALAAAPEGQVRVVAVNGGGP